MFKDTERILFSSLAPSSSVPNPVLQPAFAALSLGVVGTAPCLHIGLSHDKVMASMAMVVVVSVVVVVVVVVVSVAVVDVTEVTVSVVVVLAVVVLAVLVLVLDVDTVVVMVV